MSDQPKSKIKKRQYSEEFLKFGFIPAVHDECLPFCLLCEKSFTNETMKRGRLEAHLKAKHSTYINSDTIFFQKLKEKFGKRTTVTNLFSAQTASVDRSLEASYQIALLIAKCGKNHTIGEDLVKPSISAFLKTVLQQDDKLVKAMPLSNTTIPEE